MKTLKQISIIFFWLITGCLLLPRAECFAQVIKMSAKDLTKESSTVLYGKCSKIKCEWNEKKDKIYTFVTIVPEGYIKGNLGSETVIAVPGGRVGNILYEVSEMPFFTEGEEVVVFLNKGKTGRNLVTGGFQGKMRIEKDEKTGKRMVRGHYPEGKADGEASGAGQSGKPEKVSLEDFVSELKGYVNN